MRLARDLLKNGKNKKMTTVFGTTQNKTQALDPKVKALASSILQHESGGNYQAKGGSGEFGGYQFMPATWKSWSKRHLGIDNAEMTVANQNKVAYNQIKEWKDSGLNPAQIASKWNSGRENAYKENLKGVNKSGVAFNVPQYVKSVSAIYKTKIGSASNNIASSIVPKLSPRQQLDQQAQEQYKPTFTPQTEGESPVGEALKTVGNVPKSAFNFIKGIIDFMNPVSTFGKVKEAVTETRKFAQEEGGYGAAAKAIVTGLPKATYESVVPEAGKSLIGAGRAKLAGDDETVTKELENVQRAITSDPVGQIAPFLIAGKGLAKGLDKAKVTTGASRAFDTGISKIGRTVTKPVGSVLGGAKRLAGGSAKFTTSQATGLQPDTISQILKTPKEFSKAKKGTITRETVGREIQSVLSKQSEALKETGKAYNPIRKSTTKIKVSSDWLDKTIKDSTKLKLEKGKFKTSGAAKLREASDVRATQHLYDLWKPIFKKGEMTSAEFLNFRTDLSNLSKFERQIGKSKPVEFMAKEIHNKLNKEYRSQVKGLEKLDTEFAGRISEVNRLSEGLVNKYGELKPNAFDQIANAVGKTYKKGQLLARLEELVPGITTKLKISKAITDIENASGIKVGTYSRTALTGGAFVLGGPVQAILTAILTSPELAVPLLRGAGLLTNKVAVAKILNTLSNSGKFIGKAANKELIPGKKTTNLGKPVIPEIKKPPVPKFFEKEVKNKPALTIKKANALTPKKTVVKKLTGFSEFLNKEASKRVNVKKTNLGKPIKQKN